MERRTLGSTGLSVSVLGFGTGHFGRFGKLGEADCIRLAHAAFDGGINLIDTADFYSLGESEAITGKAIADRRDRILLATKCGSQMSDDPGERGGSRRWINLSIDRSLKRLGTDYVDLYQLHMPDPLTPIEETVEAMSDLVRAGKVRYFGLSNTAGSTMVEACLRAQLRGARAPSSEQSAYSIFNREPEADLLPACEKFGVGFLAYSPLDGGWLSGRYRRGANVEPTARHRLQPAKYDLASESNAAKLAAADALASLADEARLPLSQMAMAFVLAHRAVSCALIGASRSEYIADYVAGAEVRLSNELLDRIDAIVEPGGNLPQVRARSPALQDSALRRRDPGRAAQPSLDVSFIRRVMEDEA